GAALFRQQIVGLQLHHAAVRRGRELFDPARQADAVVWRRGAARRCRTLSRQPPGNGAGEGRAGSQHLIAAAPSSPRPALVRRSPPSGEGGCGERSTCEASRVRGTLRESISYRLRGSSPSPQPSPRDPASPEGGLRRTRERGEGEGKLA